MTETPASARERPLRSLIRECNGACGDLGTLLAHGIGAMALAGMAPVGVLFGFGAFLIGAGLFYAMPMAVQPMKAVSAAMLTGGLTPGAVAATGLMLGALFLLLGATGAIRRLARMIPQTVTTGLQLGLGLSMVALGLQLMSSDPWLAAAVLALVAALLLAPRLPAVPVALAAAVAIGVAGGSASLPEAAALRLGWPPLVVPGWADLWVAIERAVVPQIPLTLTNALIVTAAVSRDLFPEASARADERNLSLTTGIGNLLLAPLGAMPMCHGAGGVQAQYRFGARTGLAPVLLGVALVALALGYADGAAALLAAIPVAAVGALLAVAGADLARSRRLFDARPSCWPAIGVTAALTMLVNPAVGLAAGWTMEIGRGPLARAIARLRRRA